MTQPIPTNPKIYHIVHVDRLPSIIADGGLLCDSEIARKPRSGTTIGMDTIKKRRMEELTLNNYPDLYVGDCVPFYFCPRSIMLYLIYQANHPDLVYKGGQGPIVHLEADLSSTVSWLSKHGQRWVFTNLNAGSRFFEDYCDLSQLDEIDWNAVHARDWQMLKDGKQAEFLIERAFPWELVSQIGVCSPRVKIKVDAALQNTSHKPLVDMKPDWYY